MVDEHTQDEAETVEPAEEERPNRAGGESLQVVVAAVHHGFYGIPINAVREILRVPKITWIPWTPEYIVGILNVRGEMLSVVDTRLFFRREASMLTDSSRIIVLESRGFAAGLLVDSMVDILDVPITALQLVADDNVDDEVQKYITGHFHWQAVMVPLLDSNVVLQGCVVNQA